MSKSETTRQKAKRLMRELRAKTPNGWFALEATLIAGIEQGKRLAALEKGIATTLPNGETVVVKLDAAGRYVVSAKAPGQPERGLVTVGYR